MGRAGDAYTNMDQDTKAALHDLDAMRREEEALPDCVKPNTCGSCKFFEPPHGIKWRKIAHPDAFDRRLEGWCQNKIACIGATLRTGRDSGVGCKYFETGIYAPAND